MSDQYNEFYSRANSSRTFSRYCEEVYEIDLTQDGFSDRSELDMMIDFSGITSKDVILDLGCGNGKIDQYINGKTGASILGVDHSANAVDHARRLQNSALRFESGDINSFQTGDYYDAIILIDSIYFSSDYSRTLRSLYERLTRTGRIVLMYSEFLFEEDKRRRITVDQTLVAAIIAENDWTARALDLTKNLYGLMKRKRSVSEKYRDRLEEEGNEWLYRKVHDESIDPAMSFSAFEKFTNRFIYCIEKSESDD